MIVLKHKQQKRVVGHFNSDGRFVMPGDMVCDTGNKINYIVESKVWDMATGNVIGLIVSAVDKQ